MSEDRTRTEKLDEEIWTQFRKITADVLSHFFFEKGLPTLTCPICHISDMTLPQTTETIDYFNGMKDYRITYVSPTKVPSLGHEPAFSLLQYEYRLICKNCGFVNRFSVYPVFKWLSDKEKEQKGMV